MRPIVFSPRELASAAAFGCAILTAALVCLNPGHTVTQRMPSSTYIVAMFFDRPTKACLAAVYAAPDVPPVQPAGDDTLTIRPPPMARMCGMADRQTSNGAVT
jgi:hypothetical protein